MAIEVGDCAMKTDDAGQLEEPTPNSNVGVLWQIRAEGNKAWEGWPGGCLSMSLSSGRNSAVYRSRVALTANAGTDSGLTISFPLT